MRTLLLSVFSLCLTIGLSAQSLTVMSYNLRYDNQSDAPYHWDARKAGALEIITRERPQLLGVQEALKTQVDFLDQNLKGYARVGVGREDGKTEGEYSAIYYDTNRFDLKSQKNIWLSETPDEATLGWDGVCKRVMTYVILYDKKAKRDIAYLNTHFDHVGQVARAESAKLVVHTMKSVAPNMPIIFSGDLNAEPDDSAIEYILNADIVDDTYEEADKIIGGETTFHDWGKTDGGRIDYIMVSDNMFDVIEYKTIVEKPHGLYLSDHNPIVAKIKFEKR